MIVCILLSLRPPIPYPPDATQAAAENELAEAEHHLHAPDHSDYPSQDSEVPPRAFTSSSGPIEEILCVHSGMPSGNQLAGS